ncbi:MAG: hypothetical protein J6Y71_06980, partial [Ruminococcus sp.]|nr:hypothetical protein [Ruminococcus sp.]
MKLIKCPEGHSYDAEKYDICPTCARVKDGIRKGKVVKVKAVKHNKSFNNRDPKSVFVLVKEDINNTLNSVKKEMESIPVTSIINNYKLETKSSPAPVNEEKNAEVKPAAAPVKEEKKPEAKPAAAPVKEEKK